MIYEVKLVPLSIPNADGRWTHVEATHMNYDRVVGEEFVVQYRKVQPFYQGHGYPTPEFKLD